jgi:hypothetical protein
MDYYRQFPEVQIFPGFPFPPGPGGPGPGPGPGGPGPGPGASTRELERRVNQLERVVQRQGEEIRELNRRVRRLERPYGTGYGGPQY